MNVCTQTHRFCEKYGTERGIELLREAGFESIDFSMFYPIDSGIFAQSDDEVRAHFAKIREACDRVGVTVYQTHTPFPTYVANPEKDAVIFEAVRKAIIASAVLGAKHAVVHPPIMRENLYGSHAAENKKIAVDFYSRLIPTLDECGICAAVENMWHTDPVKKTICPTTCSSAEELCDYVDTLNALCKNGPRFVVCMDVGHVNLSARDMDVREYVNILGSRLQALHIHDTDGISDLHTAPGYGNIDWDSFCAGLKDVGYKGDFVFEADNFYRGFDPDLMTDAGHLLYRIGRVMCDSHGL